MKIQKQFWGTLLNFLTIWNPILIVWFFTNGHPEFTHVLSEVQDSTIVRQQRIGNFLEGPCNFKRVFPIARKEFGNVLDQKGNINNLEKCISFLLMKFGTISFVPFFALYLANKYIYV